MTTSLLPRFLLACLSSLLITSTVGDDAETLFLEGESVTLSCDINNLGNEDSIFIWAKGSTGLFEDTSIVATSLDTTRYKVDQTAKKYSLTIEDLTAEDDGSKFACKHNDGDDTKSLQTYRLKLKAAAPTAEPTAAPTPAPPAVVVVTDNVDDNGGKRVDDDDDVDVDDDDGASNEIGKEEKNLEGKGGNGAINASLSSALAASLLLLYTLSV